MPSVSSSALPVKPRPAPKRISAIPAAAASLIIAMGQPVAWPNNVAPSHPMNFLWRFADVQIVALSTTPGKPRPIGPVQAKCFAIAATAFAISAGFCSADVSIRKRSASSLPVVVSTGAPLSADPPMSMPRVFMGAREANARSPIWQPPS